jgi:hypothetical protein
MRRESTEASSLTPDASRLFSSPLARAGFVLQACGNQSVPRFAHLQLDEEGQEVSAVRRSQTKHPLLCAAKSPRGPVYGRSGRIGGVGHAAGGRMPYS